MGAKIWLMAYADDNAREALRAQPQLDYAAASQLAETLFPDEKLVPLDDTDLSRASPPNNEICIGCFPGVSIVAAKEFRGDYPSKLPKRFIDAAGNGTATLFAMHSVVDWFAFARWTDGALVRSLSLSPESGILEDIGPRMDFEEPYWSGRHPVEVDGDQPYPLPFHPLELGDAALASLLGYRIEQSADADLFNPETIPLTRYRRPRSFWKFWR